MHGITLELGRIRENKDPHGEIRRQRLADTVNFGLI
jgi:hypothetical protein